MYYAPLFDPIRPTLLATLTKKKILSKDLKIFSTGTKAAKHTAKTEDDALKLQEVWLSILHCTAQDI
eukprot:6435282-Amphidinium_carterae.1